MAVHDNVEDAITYTFTWHASANPCRKCALLNGKQWHGQTVWQAFLLDNEFGPVWDLVNDHSYAHPHCKCELDVIVDVDLERLKLG